MLDVLFGRAIDVTEKDPSSIKYGEKAEIYLGVEEAIDILAEFRVKRDVKSKSKSKLKLNLNKLRLINLVSALKVKDSWDIIAKAGGITTLELNRFLSNMRSRVRYKYLPPPYKGWGG